jgi:hypothetical protein
LPVEAQDWCTSSLGQGTALALATCSVTSHKLLSAGVSFVWWCVINHLQICETEVSTAVQLRIRVFYDLTLCCWANVSQHFEGLQYLHVQCLRAPTWHSITSKKTQALII